MLKFYIKTLNLYMKIYTVSPQVNLHIMSHESGSCNRCLCSAPHETNINAGSQNRRRDEEGEDLLKEKILDSSMTFISQHGWSKCSIAAGAEVLGYPGVIHGMFPRGGIELVQHFYVKSNKSTVDYLKARVDMTPSNQNNEPPRSLIRDTIEHRLRMIIPYLNRWPEALALMSQPQNVPTSLANLLTLVDDICFYAGDRSVSMGWYGRRIGLAGLYKVTEVYMLQDVSDDFANTWNFLNRRMEEAEHFHRAFLRTENASQFAQHFASATFTTARNILGLSWNR